MRAVAARRAVTRRSHPVAARAGGHAGRAVRAVRPAARRRVAVVRAPAGRGAPAPSMPALMPGSGGCCATRTAVHSAARQLCSAARSLCASRSSSPTTACRCSSASATSPMPCLRAAYPTLPHPSSEPAGASNVAVNAQRQQALMNHWAPWQHHNAAQLEELLMY